MHPALLAMMNQEVSFRQLTGRDAWGEPTYSGWTLTLMCRVKGGPHQVLNRNGQEVTAQVVVWAPTDSGISVDDLMTLPSDFTPQSPPIIRIDRVPDVGGMSTGNSYTKIHA